MQRKARQFEVIIECKELRSKEQDIDYCKFINLLRAFIIAILSF